MRYFIQLSYNGKNYHGWQIQPNALTVQEVLQQTFSTLLQSETAIIGAGRTDTGVHAPFFIAHFDTNTAIPDIDKFVFRLNRFLPKDIAIQKIWQVPDDWHSRFSALSRSYQYKVHFNKNPFLTDSSYFLYGGTLNFEKMNEAANILFEYQDFTSFSKLHTDTKTNNCKIMRAEWTKVGGQHIFTIQADRFLRNMVRAIVGTLLEVGREKISLNNFRKIIEAKDRNKAGTSVPGHALYLVNIEYPK